MKRTHLTAILVGLAAIVISASDAHARYYQTGINVYPAVATPMPPAPMPPVVSAPVPPLSPMVALPMPGRMPAPVAVGFDRPHVGVNVYPGVPTPMPHPDGPNLYQYVRSNPIGNLDPTGLSVKCGTISMRCESGVKTWDVYGCSARAQLILFGQTGCVTLLIPKAIFCTVSCNKIKGLKSVDENVKLLDHEAAHACAFEDYGLLGYLRAWIPGDLENPSYGDKYPITSIANW